MARNTRSKTARGNNATNMPESSRNPRLREESARDPTPDGYLDEQGSPAQQTSETHRQAPSFDEAIRGFLEANRDNLQRYLDERQVPPQHNEREEQVSSRAERQPRSPSVRIVDERHRRRDRSPLGDPRQYQHYDRPRTPPQYYSPQDELTHTPAGFEVYGRNYTPFTRRILQTPLPDRYKVPNIMPYDGLRDPRNFLSQYKYSMINQQLSEFHMCKLFPELLVDHARDWFDSLPPSSISSYAELLQVFHRRFFQKATPRTTSAHLLTLRQARDEPISDFMTRFNQESLKVRDISDLLIVSAFQNGILPGALYKEIVSTEPRTAKELWDIADRFAKADEADRKKRDADKAESSSKKREDDSRSRDRRSVLDRIQRPPLQSRLGPQLGPLEFKSGNHQDPEQSQYTPLTKSRAEIFELHTELFDAPRPTLKGVKRRSEEMYCSFHEDYGHDTEECRDLMTDIEHLVQDGPLKKYRVHGRNNGRNKNKRRPNRDQSTCTPPADKKNRREEDDDDEEDDQPQYDGVVATITGLF